MARKPYTEEDWQRIEAAGHAMQNHIPLVHAEVQERLRPVLVQDEDRRLLGLGREGQAGVNPVIGGRPGLNRGLPAEPVVDVLRPMRIGVQRAGTRVTAVLGQWRVDETQRIGDLLRRIRAARRCRIVDLVSAAGGEDREVRSHLRRLGLQKEMVVLSDKGDSLDVAGPQTYECLPGLKLKVRLIADEPHQSINLVRAVRHDTDPRIEEPRRR